MFRERTLTLGGTGAATTAALRGVPYRRDGADRRGRPDRAAGGRGWRAPRRARAEPDPAPDAATGGAGRGSTPAYAWRCPP
ncbi:hypothetical protein AB5I41_12015 [Sphingomonas sp. MMS24-JH45]